jgi:Domain of unknown function (DUF4397)
VNVLRMCLATCLLAAVGALGFAPASAKSTASLYLVQGVQGTSWSLSLDDEEVADQAPDKEIVGPLELDPGSHTVTATDDSGAEVEAEVTVASGESIDVVLHRPVDPTADPMFTTFTNDLGAVASGSGRLTVAHTAVAPPADIRVDGDVLLADVASTEQISTTVPGGVYPVDIVPTATEGPTVLGPVDLTVEAGKLTRVFAIGVAEERTMDAVVQVLPVPVSEATSPSDVPAGDGGQGAALFDTGSQRGLVVGGLLLALGAVVTLAGLRSRRQAR